MFRSSILGSTALLVACTAVIAQAPQRARPLDRAMFDTNCAPCADFNRYANGGWISHASIPAAYPTWGTWEELIDKTNDLLHQVVEDAQHDRTAALGSNTQKLGTYYGSCVDSARIEATGLAPIAPLLDMASAVRTSADVQHMIGELHTRGIAAFFGFGATIDAKQSSRFIAYAGQGPFGLPDRDFYTRTDERSRQLRAAYVQHVAIELALAGESAADAKADADRVMDLENRMALASLTRVEQRDPNASYHKMTFAELRALTPHFDWPRYLERIGAPSFTEIDVSQPKYLGAVDELLVSAPIDQWKAYLRWRVLSPAASRLGSAFVNEEFHYNQNFTGAREQSPRWKRCLSATSGALGEMLGQEYVKHTFSPEAKARAVDMVDDLRSALRERIEGLDWMSDSTKREALAKLTTLRTKIGYPDKWQDYSMLDLPNGQSFVENTMRVRAWAAARDLRRIGHDVDRAEWTIPPQTVDAYALNNEIVFPAGILQPPFFDPQADDALNYGAMGAVIGHEITHHFDDGGRKFDAAGNLRDWWTSADAGNYQSRAQRVIDQFDAYTVVDSATHVNGRLTLGENIADLGGLKIAYVALEKSLAKRGRPPLIDGFTPEQRFFIAYARVWRNVSRPEYLRNRVKVDAHAPLNWRVNGPLSNMPEFAKAFGCKAGDPMVRAEGSRAQIW
jgi:putative endopeptidase